MVSKNLNTSYVDVLKMSPTERNYMIEFLVEDAKQREEMLEKQKLERAAREKNY